MNSPQPTDPNGPDRVEQLGTYEMIWDCRFCGTKDLPALSRKFCPNCGAAQDPAARRFPSDEEKIAVTDYINRGATQICPACATPNLGDSQFCMNCGSPLDKAVRAGTIGSEVRAEGQSFAAGQERDLEAERAAQDLPPKPPSKGIRRNVWLYIAAAVVFVVLCGGLIYALTAQRKASAYVTGHEWERVISVEQFSRVPGGSWDEQVPADAYGVSCSQRQRDTRQVPDGEECSVRRVDNGDGTFSERRECQTTYRSEPVYDNYCSYTVNRWVPERQVTSSGAAVSTPPAWPAVSLASGTTLGSERESGRSERYTVLLRSGDQQYSCDLNQALWQRIPIEQTFEVNIGVVTNRLDCSALEQ